MSNFEIVVYTAGGVSHSQRKISEKLEQSLFIYKHKKNRRCYTTKVLRKKNIRWLQRDPMINYTFWSIIRIKIRFFKPKIAQLVSRKKIYGAQKRSIWPQNMFLLSKDSVLNLQKNVRCTKKEYLTSKYNSSGQRQRIKALEKLRSTKKKYLASEYVSLN